MEKNIKNIEKNKKRKTICLISITVLIVAIIGIIVIKANSNPIIGKWCYSEGKAWCYEFNKDMTGSYGTSNNKNNLTYKIDGEILHVEYENDNMSMPDTKFRIENDTLILTTSKGEEVSYIKEEKTMEQPQNETIRAEDDTEKDEELKKREEEILKQLEQEQKEQEAELEELEK